MLVILQISQKKYAQMLSKTKEIEKKLPPHKHMVLFLLDLPDSSGLPSRQVSLPV